MEQNPYRSPKTLDERPGDSSARPLPNAAHWGAIIFALAFPTLFTWVYFVALSGSEHPSGERKLAYDVGKAIQFVFPAVWVLLVERRRPKWLKPTARGMEFGIAMGLFVAGTIVTGYFYCLAPAGALQGVASMIRGKLAEFGIDSPSKMIALGVFYSLVHSLLEEYYWRWFAFGQLRRFVSFRSAAWVSSVGFMGHHVVVLWIYLPHHPEWVAVLSICIGVGGGIWAWLYECTGALYAPWISHLLIDAAIFVIGYDLGFVAR